MIGGFSRPLRSEDDPSTENKQRHNIEDAIKYSIDRLLTAYPNLSIIVLTPYWWGATGEHHDSNVDANESGVFLRYYGMFIQSTSEENFNVPVINLYNSGANKYTNRYYTKDGGHPTILMKHIISDRIKQLLNEEQ